jgi:hypothetical protein
MVTPPGQWLTLREYAERFHLALSVVQKRLEAGELVKKRVHHLNYLWVGEGEQPASEPAPEPKVESAPAPAASQDREPVSPAEALMLRTDRALGLVEKSLNTFMLMHREVMAERERLLGEMKAHEQEKIERLRELEKVLQKREQEIADLKMLVGMLEDQLSQARLQGGAGPAGPEGRTVGDLIQDQLAYLMEGQLLQKWTKD